MLKKVSMKSMQKYITVFLAIILCTTMIMPVMASAAHYNAYSTIANLPNANGCLSTQGFSTGSVYAYSIKVRGVDDSRAIIYRTNMNDGTTTLMTNGDTGLTYTTDLGHASTLETRGINGVTYMFVSTLKGGNMNIVKLRHDGATYYKVGSYSVNYNGVEKIMSGAKIYNADENNLYFLFKKGRNYYRGSIGLTANSGTINVTDAFYINIENSLVDGSTVPDITSYTLNGFGYFNDTIYVPMTKGNISIVMVYHNVSTATGTLYADTNLSFRIIAASYPQLFEIEGLDVGVGNKLYFDTNRKVDEDDLAHDAVHYFKDFVAQ
jgi:hypothetical protein